MLEEVGREVWSRERPKATGFCFRVQGSSFLGMEGRKEAVYHMDSEVKGT
jgi:hypothetical protein